VETLAREFVAAIRAGRHRQEGWPNSMYGISKLCESTFTRVLAGELEGQGIMVNAVCPGYCATDMSSWKGTKSAAAGADTPVWAALRPPADAATFTGGFYQERRLLPW
jgi:carbonyl reductase 1